MTAVYTKVVAMLLSRRSHKVHAARPLVQKPQPKNKNVYKQQNHKNTNQINAFKCPNM